MEPEPIEIVAGDVVLRPWHPDDAEAVYRACQDPDIQRWTPIPSPYGRADADDFVTRGAPAGWADGSAAHFGVFSPAGDLLGACGLGQIETNHHTASLGYWTAPWARGKGVALTATRAVAAWAFEHLDLALINWRAEIGNHASRLVALRAGFQVDGETRSLMHATGRPETWVGTLLPRELTMTTPDRYATGSLVARRAAVFGGRPPVLPLLDRPGALRPPTGDDLDPVTAACQDPESARWTTVPVPYARADAENFMFNVLPAGWARGRVAGFVVSGPSGEYLGSIDLRLDPEDAGTCEVGFLMAPTSRGQGYATSALRTICAWGFATLGLCRVIWRAHVGNEGSRRVAEKAGFTMEGVQRSGLVQRGERRDAWTAALLATDLP